MSNLEQFVMYCPEKKQYVKSIELQWLNGTEAFIDFTFTNNLNEAEQILLDKDTDRNIKRFGYEFELKLRREL